MIAWQRDLEDATTSGEVVQLARRFVGSMPREAFAGLPAHCRPAFISGPDDVRDWSERLNRAYWEMRATSSDTDVMQQVWSFFLRATIRLARIEEERAVS